MNNKFQQNFDPDTESEKQLKIAMNIYPSNFHALYMKFNKLLEEESKFVEAPTFITLFTGSQVEPLYFVQVTENGIAESKLSNPYGHVILPGEIYFKGHYLKLVRSRNISIKQLAILPTVIYVSPDEIYDTCVDIDGNLQMDVNINNSLLYKARI